MDWWPRKEAIAFLYYKEEGVIYIGIHKTGAVAKVNDIYNTMLKIKNIQTFCKEIDYNPTIFFWSKISSFLLYSFSE